MKRLKAPPPVYFLFCALLSMTAKNNLKLTQFNNKLLPMCAYLVIGIGCALIIWAIIAMKKHKTTVMPFREPSKLLTSGPFSISRNPIYLGKLIILFGLCLYWQNIGSFIGPIIFFFIMDHRFIPYEEAKLKDLFPDQANNYFQSTKRWI